MPSALQSAPGSPAWKRALVADEVEDIEHAVGVAVGGAAQGEHERVPASDLLTEDVAFHDAHARDPGSDDRDVGGCVKCRPAELLEPHHAVLVVSRNDGIGEARIRFTSELAGGVSRHDGAATSIRHDPPCLLVGARIGNVLPELAQIRVEPGDPDVGSHGNARDEPDAPGREDAALAVRGRDRSRGH